MPWVSKDGTCELRRLNRAALWLARRGDQLEHAGMLRFQLFYLESQWLRIMGYFKPSMVYFGLYWPLISGYLAVQVVVLGHWVQCRTLADAIAQSFSTPCG